MPDLTNARPADATTVQDDETETATLHPQAPLPGDVVTTADARHSDQPDYQAVDVTGDMQPAAPVSLDTVSEADGTQHGVTGTRWGVTDEANPFHRRLLVTHDSATILDLPLDPLLLQELLYSLAVVRESQRAALGLGGAHSAAIPTTPPGSATQVPTAPAETANNRYTHEPAEDASTGTWTDDTPAAEPDDTAPSPAQSPAPAPFPSLGWWRSHKLLAFLLLFGAFFFMLGTINPT